MISSSFSLLTIDHILKHTSQEALWVFYFGKFNLNEKYNNPLRNDRKADCTFDYGESGDLLFADWAKKIHYTIWDFVSKKYSLSFYETLQKIASDFEIPHLTQSSSDLLLGSIKIQTEEKKLRKINRLKDIIPYPIKPTKEHFDYWSTFDYQYTLDDFKKYKNIPIKKYTLVFEKSSVTYTPKTIAFCYGISKTDKQIYLPYASKENKFRQIITNPLIRINEFQKGKPLLITKSIKDNIINDLTKLANIDNIIAEGYKPSSQDIMYMANAGKVYTLFDPDDTGIEASEFWRDNFNTIPLFLSDFKDSYLNYKNKGLGEHTKELKSLLK